MPNWSDTVIVLGLDPLNRSVRLVSPPSQAPQVLIEGQLHAWATVSAGTYANSAKKVNTLITEDSLNCVEPFIEITLARKKFGRF
jgi:hypothetical protein